MVADLQKQLEGQPKFKGKVLLSARDVEDLKKRGLKDPVNDVVQDLLKRNDLIPYPGVLGGTMRFLGESEWVVGRQWVFARACNHTVRREGIHRGGENVKAASSRAREVGVFGWNKTP